MAAAGTNGSDPINAAIVPAGTIAMRQFNFTLATGRPIALAVPADATDAELLGVVNAVLEVGDRLRAAKPKSPIALVRSLPTRA